jgi:hypothetical protein
MPPKKKQKVSEQGNKLSYTPLPKVSYLESLSPTDECFTEAISSKKSVFPSTKEERDTLAAQKKEADDAAAAKNYALAESIAKQYKLEKLEVSQKDLEFEFVCKCEKDAKAAHAMEMTAMEYTKAGEWCLVYEACQARLNAYRERQREVASAEARDRAAEDDDN